MKLIMAVSKEGYVARTAEDDMTWTGGTDKAIFRLLTSVGGHIACGSKTMMPSYLPGRTLHTLSRKPWIKKGELATKDIVHDLDWFYAHHHQDGWLIGGQTIAMDALNKDLVDEFYLCQSDRKCFPLSTGQPYLLDRWVHGPRWVDQAPLKINDVTVAIWKRDRASQVN